MNLLNLVICLISLLVYSAAFIAVFYVIPGYRPRKSKLPLLIFGAVFTIITVLINFLIPANDLFTVFDALLVIVSMIAPYLVFVPQKKLTFLLFGGVIMIAFDYVRSFIISLLPGETITGRKEMLISLAVYSFTLILLALFHGRISAKIPEGFIEGISPFIYVMIYIAFFASSYESMLGRTDLFDSAVSSVLKLISTGLVIAAVTHLVYRYFSVFTKQKESEMQLEMELRHYEEAMEKNRDIRRFRHDYKNNLISLKAFIESGRNGEAMEYIEDLTGNLETAAMHYNTGNYLADAIISDKAKSAGEKNIGIRFEGRIPPEGIKNSDICTILANSLDNAVRACEEQAPCEISIASETKKSGVILKIANPVKEKVVIKNNSIKTTKSDKDNHGLGIENVKKAAANYGGSVTLSCTDSEFCVEIILPV